MEKRRRGRERERVLFLSSLVIVPGHSAVQKFNSKIALDMVHLLGGEKSPQNDFPFEM